MDSCQDLMISGEIMNCMQNWCHTQIWCVFARAHVHVSHDLLGEKTPDGGLHDDYLLVADLAIRCVANQIQISQAELIDGAIAYTTSQAPDGDPTTQNQLHTLFWMK